MFHFGLANDYESSFQGRYHGSYSKVQVTTLQPTIAYRIQNNISIGGGITVNRIENNLQSDLATGFLNGGQDTHITIKGNDIALGFNLGLLIDLNESTTWGATYHSKVVFHADGSTQVSNAPSALGVNGTYSNQLATTTPEMLDTSFTHHFDERWTGYLGTTWTRWSRVQRVDAINSGVSPLGQQLGFGNIGDNFDWHNTWSAAIGASYRLSPQWLLRCGYAYDQSPASDANRNVRVPVGNRQALTLGASYALSTNLTIDMAYGYLWEPAVSVNQANTSGLQPSYSAEYHNSAT